MPPKTPSRPPVSRSSSARLSRQASASTPVLNGHAKTAADEKQAKPANGTSHPHTSPEFSDNVNFVTPTVSPAKKAVTRSRTSAKPKVRPTTRPSLLSVLLRLSLLSLMAYTFLCPITSASPDQRITGPCTLLARAHADIYNPFVGPHVSSAWNSVSSNPTVGPYAKHVESAYNYATPYVSSARATARGRLIPVFDKVQDLSSHAYSQVYSTAKPYVDPYVAKLSAAVDPYRSYMADIHRRHVRPRFLALRAQSHHAMHLASPYLLRARIALRQTYERTRPYAYASWQHTKAFLVKVGASVPIVETWDLYVRPHWDRIMKQVGQMKEDAEQKAGPVMEQAHSTFSVASESAASMVSAAQGHVASLAGVAQSSFLSAASVAQSVASEYVSIVQDKLSSASGAAQATGTIVAASAASASHKASDVIVDAASAGSASAVEYASHVSHVASQASATASEYIADAASFISESVVEYASHASVKVAAASSAASDYVSSAASAVSSSAADYATTASTALSQATAGAAHYASAAEENIEQVGAAVHFKAGSLASSASSKAAAVASSASEVAASASAKIDEAREAVGIHEGDSQAAADDSAQTLGKLTPVDLPTEAEVQEEEADFETWFAGILDGDTPRDIGTRNVLPPSVIAQGAAPAEIPADKSAPRYKAPSAEEVAEKRQGVEVLHNKWEEMLHVIGQGAVERLEREVARVRQASGEKLLGEDGGVWGKDVAAYEKEVGRVVTGVERYANKLRNEDRPSAEKTEKLQDVVGKVRGQVEVWAGDVESKLKTWWIGSEAGIVGDIEKAEKDVLDIASQAQAELGMKYAYLDDVTTQDWSRYHALLDDAKSYGKKYRDLLYLSEESPLYKALAELTSHIQDVLLGFEARLALVHPFADAPVSGAGDADPLLSPQEPEQKPQAPFFLPGAMAQPAGTDAFLKRSKEEVEHALEQAQAAAEEILDEAKGTWHSATRAASKAAGATPTPETVEEYYDFAKAQAGEQVHVVYDQASSVVHDATRSVINAAGGTPTPENLQEHAENIVAMAQDAYDTAASVVESVYGAATSNVQENIHHGTRAAVKAAGGTPTPETAEEFYEYARGYAADAAQVAYDSASSFAHDAGRTLVKAAGGSPTPESLQEHYESVVDRAHSVAGSASSVVESAYGAATSNVYENIHQATRSVQSAVGSSPSPETVEEYYDFAKAQAQAAYEVVGEAVHDATRTIIKAAGGTPTPENLSEHASSLAGRASDAAGAAYASASSAAASLNDQIPGTDDIQARVEEILSSASAAIEEAAGGATNLAESVYDAGSSALHQATRTVIKAAGGTPEPESLKEHYESVVARASEVVAGAAVAAEDVLDSVYSSAHSATRSIHKAMGGSPTPESFEEHYESVVARATDAASAVYDSASSVVHQGTRTVMEAVGATPSPENLAETVSSLTGRAADSAASIVAVIESLAEEAEDAFTSATDSVKSAAGVQSAKPLTERAASSVYSVLDSLASEADDTLTKATDSVKSAAGVETAKPVTERVSSSVAAAASSASSFIYHEEL